MDEDILRNEGVTDFTKYAMDPGQLKKRVHPILDAPLTIDFFVPGAEYGGGGHFGTDDKKRSKSRAALKAADVAESVAKIRKAITAQHVEKIKTVFEFTLKGKFILRLSITPQNSIWERPELLVRLNNYCPLMG